MEIDELVSMYSESFDKLCQERHAAGQQEYGQFTFLGNDVVRMMMEELADTSNYCRMQFIKLMLLQEALEGKLSEETTDGESITIGVKSFKGTRDIGWDK